MTCEGKIHEALRGATGSGNVLVGNGATAGVCYVNSVGTTIASFNTNIGNLGNTAVVVNVGFNDAGGPVGTVNIGRGATAVTIGNTAAGFRSAGPITLGTPPPFGSSGSGPYLGNLIAGPNIAGTVVSSTATTVNSVTVPFGSWIIFGAINYNSYAGDFATGSISSTNNVVDNTCILVLRFSGTFTQQMSLTRGVVVSSTTTFYLVGQTSGGVATSSVTMYAIRVG